MTKPRRHKFWRDEIWARRRQIFFHPNALFSALFTIAAVVAIAIWGKTAVDAMSSIASIGTALATYAGITFAGTLAAATLAVALPPSRLLTTLTLNGSQSNLPAVRIIQEGAGIGDQPKRFRLSRTDTGDVPAKDYFKDDFRSRYSNLIFLFVYSSLVQLTAMVLAIACTTLFGASEFLGNKQSFTAVACIGVLLLIGTYSVAQLFATLNALFDVGALRDLFTRTGALEGRLGPEDS